MGVGLVFELKFGFVIEIDDFIYVIREIEKYYCLFSEIFLGRVWYVYK